MNLTVNYKGLEVRCESLEDLDVLAAHAEAQSVSVRGVSEQRDSAGRRLLMAVNRGQEVRLLAEVSTGPRTDAELCQRLGLRTESNDRVRANKALAGSLAAVSRAAKRIGLGKPLNQSIGRMDSGDRKYVYSMSPKLAAEIRDALSDPDFLEDTLSLTSDEAQKVRDGISQLKRGLSEDWREVKKNDVGR